MGIQCGGWSVGWRGRRGDITPRHRPSARRSRRSSARRAIDYSENAAGAEKADVVVVVVGEDPYAEGSGDRAKLSSARRTWRWSRPRSAAASRSWSCCSRGGRSSWATCWTRRARWSPPGCPGPRATASPTCSSARTNRPASSRARGRANMAQIPINVGDRALRAAVPVRVRAVLVSARVAALFAVMALGAGSESWQSRTTLTRRRLRTRTRAHRAGWTFRKVAHQGAPQRSRRSLVARDRCRAACTPTCWPPARSAIRSSG